MLPELFCPSTAIQVRLLEGGRSSEGNVVQMIRLDEGDNVVINPTLPAPNPHFCEPIHISSIAVQKDDKDTWSTTRP